MTGWNFWRNFSWTCYDPHSIYGLYYPSPFLMNISKHKFEKLALTWRELPIEKLFLFHINQNRNQCLSIIICTNAWSTAGYHSIMSINYPFTKLTHNELTNRIASIFCRPTFCLFITMCSCVTSLAHRVIHCLLIALYRFVWHYQQSNCNNVRGYT